MRGFKTEMEQNFEAVVVFLLIAAVVAIVTRRLKLPYSVGLVATGMVVAVIPFIPKITLTKDLIFTALLPPLLFEAAFSLQWSELRRDLPVIGVLATAGVLVSAGITAAGMHFIAQWEWLSALVFGVLIAATDPVSVIAVFREAGAHGRLRLLVESESLFNDGTAAVAFAIAIAFALGGELSTGQIVRDAVLNTGGGILCGAIIGQLALSLIVTTEDHLVETACTNIAAYGSFLLAEALQVSGVFATIVAGIVLRNVGSPGRFSARGREAVQTFWEYAAFVANSIIFLLIGMHQAAHEFRLVWFAALVAIVVVTLGRAAAIYPLCAVFARSSLRVSPKHQHVLFWGGLRGALALALVLSLPDSIPRRDAIVRVAFAVVAFSIFVQGLTIGPLLRRLKETPRRAARIDSELR